MLGFHPWLEPHPPRQPAFDPETEWADAHDHLPSDADEFRFDSGGRVHFNPPPPSPVQSGHVSSIPSY